MSGTTTSFQVDKETLEEIEKLKVLLNARDSAEVIRKALALAKIAAANTSDDNVLTILSPNDVRKQVKLRG
jgi:hypothetical protein